MPIRGPGRYLHFLAAWVCVFTGLVYVLTGLVIGHFARSFVPGRGDLSVRAMRDVVAGHLRKPHGDEVRDGLQRLAASHLHGGRVRVDCR